MQYNTPLKIKNTASLDVISLTQKLIQFNTVNPPGNESGIAKFVGRLLTENGFDVKYHVFTEGRLHVIAEKGLSEKVSPIVLSGHFDTVPLGAKKWSVEPYSGKVIDDKLFGRGSSDMKGGLASMVCAAIQVFKEGLPKGGVRLILTSAEELGCQGMVQLSETYNNFGSASAIVIGEPTSNIPAIGHKGALYLNASATGITAHSSMPELGDNAIYKVARAISKIEKFKFDAEIDPLLGFPTANVGKIQGGINLNSVPDYAEFSIDMRLTGKINHKKLIKKLRYDLGDEISLEILVDLQAVRTDETNPFVQLVYNICKYNKEKGPVSLPYLTDGSVLQKLYNGTPTIILGPGQSNMAHQTNEYCFTDKIIQAVEIYKNIIIKNGELN